MAHQQVVEHEFTEIIRPAFVRIVQVAGTVHEHHCRVFFRRIETFRRVNTGMDRAFDVR